MAKDKVRPEKLADEEFEIIDDKMILRKSDGSFIPFDEDNVDYREYLEWKESGKAPAITYYLPSNLRGKNA